jgi:uncharacterized protein (TIGR01777 family)
MAGARTIAVTGASGFVGSALVPSLAAAGNRVVRLTRAGSTTSSPAEDVVPWDPGAGVLDPGSLRGVEAVVHLSGESVATGRWTSLKKQRIRESRVGSTRLLSDTLARLERPPRVLVSASGVGYYGDRGAEPLREDSAPGKTFLAEVCRDWEAATRPASERGIRVVMLRMGMVLSPKGGALATLLTPFSLGAGGPVGTGAQYVSWITLDDLLAVVGYALSSESLRGPVNAVSPGAVTYGELARTLGRVLGRPAFLPLPAVVARLMFGEMADEVLLASARVEPARLQAAGYVFQQPTLEGALRHLLAR